MPHFIYAIDHAVSAFFFGLRTPVGISISEFVTFFGQSSWVVIFAVLFCIYLWWWRESFLIKYFVWGLIVNEGVVFLLKHIVRRPRQLGAVILETDASFPSGHAAAAVFLYGFLIFYVTKSLSNRLWRGVVRVISLLFLILVPVSRLYLGEHYLTDVLASLLIASTVLFCTVKWWEKASIRAQK